MTTNVAPPTDLTRSETPLPPTTAHFIDGLWRASSGTGRDILDPSTGEVVLQTADGSEEDVDCAVAAARRAFDHGPWSTMPPRDRGRILLKAAALMREHHEDLARLESLDTGKPIKFSRMIDAQTVVEEFEYFGSLAATIEGATRTTGLPTMAYTRREPIGVVAAITPFNFPLILSATKIAPALAAGNTVVHKPAEETPLTALRIAEILTEAGLPPGVLNVVTGGGPTGHALATDPRIDKIAFTGSTAVGRAIAAEAAQTLKHVTVELGGKSANLIFADADMDTAIRNAINGFVFNTGQFCMAGTRLLVERPVYADVVAALQAAVEHLPIGDPFHEETVIGPMAGPRHLEKVASFVNRARAQGVEVLGGEQRDARGFWAAPTILADVEQTSDYVQHEIFGPVLTVQPFDTEDDAVQMANGTMYGLAAGLQTNNLARAHRVAAALDAGMIWVNGWGHLDVAMPIGGYKQSGYGREGGPEGLSEYLQTKSVVISL